MTGAPRLQAEGLSKRFGGTVALDGVSLAVAAGAVTGLLGDNGAGKSTLIKILSGALRPTAGTLRVDGAPVRFDSPRDARRHGIATVYQDLSVAPLMSIWRNFFLGSEPMRGWGPVRWLDARHAREAAREALGRIGIEGRDPDQPVGTLSGGERQALAIARAVHFGARVLILDEPTAALGVRQAEIVLRYVREAKERGVAVVLITHNPRDALAVGDRFVVLRRGRTAAVLKRSAATRDGLMELMAGGAAAGA